MSSVVDSIRAEYQRYQTLAERALDQVPEALLVVPGPGGGNSLTTIAWHIAGNLRSRFSGFLTEDGEKPWRNRDDEFAPRRVSRAALDEHWRAGWATLYDALMPLTDGDLHGTVSIRGQALSVHDALHRSLAHVSYHVGQIVYVAHAHRGPEWEYLSIPPGRSAEYNQSPTLETPGAHVAHLGTARAHADRATPNDLRPLPDLAVGRYRHYKGGEYEVLAVVRHSESLEPLVLYRPLYNDSGSWVRPYAMFHETVDVDGERRPRFIFLGTQQ